MFTGLAIGFVSGVAIGCVYGKHVLADLHGAKTQILERFDAFEGKIDSLIAKLPKV